MSKFSNLFENDTPQKIIVIDGHNLIFRTLFIAEKHKAQFDSDDDDNFSYWKFIFFKSVLNIITQFEPTKLIMVMDEKNTWRKDYYSEYKAQRKAARENSKIDFAKFFPIFDSFYDDMIKTIPNIMYLKVDRCEGDDLIAVITKHYTDAKIEIISTDRDLNQLMKRKNVKQYDPVKRVYINSLNPIVDLEVKILTGDKGDNIPAIKPKTGPVTAANIITNNKLESMMEADQTVRDNYERNKLLIDLDMIPSDIVKNITEVLNSYTLSQFDGKKFFNFVVKHRLANTLDNPQETTGILKRLDEFIGS